MTNLFWILQPVTFTGTLFYSIFVGIFKRLVHPWNNNLFGNETVKIEKPKTTSPAESTRMDQIHVKNPEKTLTGSSMGPKNIEHTAIEETDC